MGKFDSENLLRSRFPILSAHCALFQKIRSDSFLPTFVSEKEGATSEIVMRARLCSALIIRETFSREETRYPPICSPVLPSSLRRANHEQAISSASLPSNYHRNLCFVVSPFGRKRREIHSDHGITMEQISFMAETFSIFDVGRSRQNNCTPRNVH